MERAHFQDGAYVSASIFINVEVCVIFGLLVHITALLIVYFFRVDDIKDLKIALNITCIYRHFFLMT